MRDIYQEVTDKLVAALEQAGEWQPPWHRHKGGMPVNAYTQNKYRGVNVLTLWLGGMAHASHRWASLKQWNLQGKHVKKGEQGTMIVWYGEMMRANAEAPDDPKKIPILKFSYVFNEAQLVGFEPPPPPALLDESLRDPRIDNFVRQTGASIRYDAGFNPCYIPSIDEIRMPPFPRFKHAPGFYNTQFHEMVHWSGHKARLNRELAGRFKHQAYAAEELVAEIGAAFMSAEFGLPSQMREDHAPYVASWIKLLKEDKRAIFTAASRASDAAAFLLKQATVQQEHHEEPVMVAMEPAE